MMSNSNSPLSPSLVARTAAWLVFALAGLNTLIYVLIYSDPLIASDGWYFVRVFVRPALEGTLQPGDFFVSRMGLDHVQPLRKLILLAELYWFDLDYVPQAVVGVLCAGGCSLIVAWALRQTDGCEVSILLRSLVWAVATAILFSLNGTNIWTWPLVAVGYTTHVITFGFLGLLWIALRSGRVGWLALVTLLLAVVGDDTAIIVAAAILPVLVMLWVRDVHRESISRVLMVVIGVVFVVQVLMAWLAPMVGNAPTVDDRWNSLWQTLLDDGWWKWWVLPLSNSLISSIQLGARVQEPIAWRLALGLLFAAAHFWFWWRFLRMKVNGASFFAAALMMLFYAMVAGIILGRVAMFDSNYLNQQRYVVFYQFHLLALLVMFVATYARPRRLLQRSLAVGVSVVLVMVLALQVSLSKESWRIAPWIHIYQQKLAQQTISLAEYPQRLPEKCLPQLSPCYYDAEMRRDVITLLQKHQLSVFSPAFRERHEHLFRSVPAQAR